MYQLFEDTLRGRVEELKALYAQLFVLLDSSVNEEPDENGLYPRSEELRAPLAGLMNDIRGCGQDFSDMLGAQPNWRELCSPEFAAEVEDFKGRLSGVLESMAARIQERMKDLEERRERLKDDLQALNGKQKTRAGYKSPAENPVSMLFSSEA